LFASRRLPERQVSFEEYPAPDAGATACADPASNEHLRRRYQNSITRAQIGCARAKMAPYCYSTLADVDIRRVGTQIEANIRRGVFRVEI
jgi:hypothetical protein